MQINVMYQTETADGAVLTLAAYNNNNLRLIILDEGVERFADLDPDSAQEMCDALKVFVAANKAAEEKDSPTERKRRGRHKK